VTRKIVSDGVEIHYEVRGEGPAILFHTGAGGDRRIWEEAGYVDALPGFRKILMDQRGRGQSGRPASVDAHRMEHCVSDVAAVLDDAGVSSAAFWAYSNGIFVGLAFGAAHPGRLEALIGIGTLPYYDICDLPPIEDPQAFIEEQITRGGVSAEVGRFMQEEGERFPAAIDRNVRDGDARMYALGRLARRSWRGPKSLYATFSPAVLILAGEKENDEGETARSVMDMPQAQLVRIAGVGHLASFYRSDLTVPHALPFLREHLAIVGRPET
jgi:pimeloyl-ACP methyl ester carboxylesterase